MKVEGCGLRVEGPGFRVYGSGFMVDGSLELQIFLRCLIGLSRFAFLARGLELTG